MLWHHQHIQNCRSLQNMFWRHHFLIQITYPKQRKGQQFLEPLSHKGTLETKMGAYNGRGKKNNQNVFVYKYINIPTWGQQRAFTELCQHNISVMLLKRQPFRDEKTPAFLDPGINDGSKPDAHTLIWSRHQIHAAVWHVTLPLGIMGSDWSKEKMD